VEIEFLMDKQEKEGNCVDKNEFSTGIKKSP